MYLSNECCVLRACVNARVASPCARVSPYACMRCVGIREVLRACLRLRMAKSGREEGTKEVRDAEAVGCAEE